MPETLRRPLTLADAMLLVAAMTPGLILLRIAAGFGLFKAEPFRKLPPGRYFAEFLSVAGGCVLLSLTLAVLILAARRPRPTVRDVVGGPGILACLAVMVALVLPLAYFATGVMTSHGLVVNMIVPYNNMFGRLVNGAGPMIIGAWLALSVVGRWRLQPTWTDRFGCVVGACWVLLDVFLQLNSIGLLPLLLRWAT